MSWAKDEIKDWRNLIKQILKFVVTGGTTFLIDFFLLWLFTDICGINYLISNVLSFSLSTIYNFALSVKWVFDVIDQRTRARNLMWFFILSIAGLGLQQLLMWITVDFWSWHYLFAKFIVSVVVGVFNFITRKVLFEKERAEKEQAA